MIARADAADPKRVSAIEKRFIKFLDSDAGLAAKDVICRQLALIASQASVPVLSKLVQKPAASDMARYVLEKIPGEAADKALRHALATLDGELRVGVINSVGARRDRKAVRLLIPLLNSPDTVDAAATALSRIGDGEAVDALLSAKTTADERIRGKAQEALMDWADERLAEGRNRGAFLIYREMAFMSEMDHIRIAGLRGLLRSAGAAALPTLLSAVTDGEAAVQGAVVKLLVELETPNVTKQVIKAYPTLPDLVKVRFLSALGEGKDGASVSFVMGEAKKGADPVRAAALAALSRMGDASCVSLLSTTAADSSGTVQDAARGGLYRMKAKDVDQAIVAGLLGAVLPVKLELLRAIAERGITNAAPVLAEALKEPQPDVRREALKALLEVGSEAEVPALLSLLSSTESDPERDQAGRAVASACRRSAGKGLDQVLAAYSSAGRPAVRVALVGVVGSVGSKEGLPLLTGALRESDMEVRRAAILALGEWPNADPVPNLLAAAREASLPAHHALALRGYLKLVSLPADRPPAESVSLVSNALQAAKDPEMKKAALAVLPRFVCKEAVDLATAASQDPAVKPEADQAVTRLKEALGYK